MLAEVVARSLQVPPDRRCRNADITASSVGTCRLLDGDRVTDVLLRCGPAACPSPAAASSSDSPAEGYVEGGFTSSRAFMGSREDDLGGPRDDLAGGPVALRGRRAPDLARECRRGRRRGSEVAVDPVGPSTSTA